MPDVAGGRFDVIVVGGGPSGCAVAGSLANSGGRAVLLLEAGPDYGVHSDLWPSDLLDASDLAESHAWGYDSGSFLPGRTLTYDRARVIGGCSSHNGCAAIWGHRLDYDTWAAEGNPGWSTDDLLPHFLHASHSLRVRIPTTDEVTPYQQIILTGAGGAGIPLVDDLNNLDESVGMAPSPANIYEGIRWNGAFAYLDPLRSQSNLTILGDCLVDRVIFEGDRAIGVEAVQNKQRVAFYGDEIVLAAGTYCSPGILVRSGIGSCEDLKALGIDRLADLPGVGKNLHDHPNVDLLLAGSYDLFARMSAFQQSNWMPEEQTIAKARSTRCSEAFDIHIYPAGGPYSGDWKFEVPVACMTPQSRGSVTIASTDPETKPLIDTNFLSDPEGHDLDVMVDAVRLARELISYVSEREILGAEVLPGPAISSDTDLRRWIRANVCHYYHPVGTCKMGPKNDPGSVVDPQGRVRGVQHLRVADCSIIPRIPRANTNIPAAVVGARIASFMGGSFGG